MREVRTRQSAHRHDYPLLAQQHARVVVVVDRRSERAHVRVVAAIALGLGVGVGVGLGLGFGFGFGFGLGLG